MNQLGGDLEQIFNEQGTAMTMNFTSGKSWYPVPSCTTMVDAWQFQLLSLAISLTYGLWSLGGAIGSQIAGIWGAKFGRKNTLLLNNVFIIPGILLQVIKIFLTSKHKFKIMFATLVFKVCTFQTRVMSYDWILVGRFINGMGCGVAATISPVYLAEIAPLHLRGALGASYSLLWVQSVHKVYKGINFCVCEERSKREFRIETFDAKWNEEKTAIAHNIASAVHYLVS